MGLRDDQALWLPPKSVRALLAGGMWALTGYLLVTGQEVPGELWTIDGTITAFYYASSV